MNQPSLLSVGQRRAVLILAALGGAALLAGAKLHIHRALAALLLGNAYFLMLAALALAFVAIQNLSGAGWSTLFRRVPEAMTSYLPAGAAAMAVTIASSRSLYHWAHAESGVHDPILHAKAGYLNLPFWAARAALALALWWIFSRALVANSRAQDHNGSPELVSKAKRLSAGYLVAFALTFTLASIDWVMSLEPHWYSTMFPWYMFSGAFLQALAAIALATLALRRRGFYPELNEHHRHDLGKLIFAFSAFWAYLWFSQFLLIWYANIPEEIAYFAARSSRGWLAAQAAVLLFNFLLPAALLLRADAKKTEGVLLAACLSVLAGRWLDLYVMIMPSVSPGASPRWEDAAATAALGAVFVLLFDKAFSSAPPYPARDPFLEESLHHQG